MRLFCDCDMTWRGLMNETFDMYANEIAEKPIEVSAS